MDDNPQDRKSKQKRGGSDSSEFDDAELRKKIMQEDQGAQDEEDKLHDNDAIKAFEP